MAFDCIWSNIIQKACFFLGKPTFSTLVLMSISVYLSLIYNIITEISFQIYTYMFLFFDIDDLVHVYVIVCVLKGVNLQSSAILCKNYVANLLPPSFLVLILENSVTNCFFYINKKLKHIQRKSHQTGDSKKYKETNQTPNETQLQKRRRNSPREARKHNQQKKLTRKGSSPEPKTSPNWQKNSTKTSLDHLELRHSIK